MQAAIDQCLWFRAFTNRAALDLRLAETLKRFVGQAVPRPQHWGVYCLAL
ncbi:Pyridoxamine 5'-phosphate oxidase [Pseudomonas synxantha]|nr:Pyridoxamine 5'-phosphate oxidase [Pseudomonas synxantha]